VTGVDCADPGSTEAWIHAELPDLGGADEGGFTLVHLAWDMRRGDAEGQRRSVEIFGQLLENPNLRGVVGLGSAEEYGGLEGKLREEMEFGGGLSAYGAAKHEAMGLARTWAERTGRRVYWLRPFIVYGEGQRGDMVIPYAIRRMLRGEAAELSAAEQRRDFVHVDDVARGICEAAARAGKDGGGFVRCNLGSGRATRLKDVLERAGKLAGGEEWLRFGARPMRAGEPAEQYADTAAAERELGWRAAIAWEDGMARTVAAARKEAEA